VVISPGERWAAPSTGAAYSPPQSQPNAFRRRCVRNASSSANRIVVPRVAAMRVAISTSPPSRPCACARRRNATSWQPMPLAFGRLKHRTSISERIIETAAAPGFSPAARSESRKRRGAAPFFFRRLVIKIRQMHPSGARLPVWNPKRSGRCRARGFFVALDGVFPTAARPSPSKWKSQSNSIQFENSQRS
jgi:hypothetical protein